MPTATNHEAHNCIQSLFDTLIDIGEGYDVLLERAEPAARASIKILATLHRTAIDKIDALAAEQGFELDHSGTLMSEVHKAAVKLRDLFSDIDRNALEAIVDGEENVIKRYDDAIRCLSPDNPLHRELIAQRDALRIEMTKIFEVS